MFLGKETGNRFDRLSTQDTSIRKVPVEPGDQLTPGVKKSASFTWRLMNDCSNTRDSSAVSKTRTRKVNVTVLSTMFVAVD